MSSNPEFVLPRRRRRRGGAAEAEQVTPLTFRTSSTKSMEGNREWLLEHQGPHCAYCGKTFNPEAATLDHVRPRKGQKAYDRLDNLVICCRDCNAAKADMPMVSWLLQKKSRAVFLLEYGGHLSEPLKESARHALDRPMIDLTGKESAVPQASLRFRRGKSSGRGR